MLKMRSGLKLLFRGATPEEYAIIHAAASERQQWAEEDRSVYPAPDEAELSIGGAFLWTTLIIWQDHPIFVSLGVAGALVSTVCRIWGLFG